MSMKADIGERDLIVLCAGGHARVVIDILGRAGLVPAGIIDANSSLAGTEVLGVPVLGGDEILESYKRDRTLLINALGNRPGGGSSGLRGRRTLFERNKQDGFGFARVQAADASVSAYAQLGEGVHVITRAVVQPGTKVGDNCILNTGASLDHDCIVGAHSHIAPWAVLCGGVTIGKECHVGARAVIIPGVTVGDGAVIGAGAVVVDDVPPGITMTGNPARPVSAQPG